MSLKIAFKNIKFAVHSPSTSARQISAHPAALQMQPAARRGGRGGCNGVHTAPTVSGELLGVQSSGFGWCCTPFCVFLSFLLSTLPRGKVKSGPPPVPRHGPSALVVLALATSTTNHHHKHVDFFFSYAEKRPLAVPRYLREEPWPFSDYISLALHHAHQPLTK